MEIRFPPLLFVSLILFACNGKLDKQSKDSAKGTYSLITSENLNVNPHNNYKNVGLQEKYTDGTYCAKVQYYNPNTGTRSTYVLTVEVYDSKIIKVNFPDGHLDTNNSNIADIDKEGVVSFTSEQKYRYKIQILKDKKDCFKGIPQAKRCKGITKSGTRCKHLTDNPNGLCWQHRNQ